MATGRCLCGEIAFELAEPLSEIELCHCRKCRRAYGAPFAATLYLRKEGFRWLRGRAFVATYDAPLEQSPPSYRHSFCKRCGSPLPLLWADLPFVEVPAASLDDEGPSRPAYQMFESQRLSWVAQTHRLRGYERGAPLREKVLRAVL